MFIGNIVSAPLTKYYSDVALVCVGQTLIAIAALGALFYSHIPWLAISSMSLAAFGYFFISGPMQALIIAGAGDAKAILAALGQIAITAPMRSVPSSAEKRSDITDLPTSARCLEAF